MQWVPGDPKQPSVNLGGGENVRKGGWKGEAGRSLRVLTFRVEQEVSSHAGRRVFVWGESQPRASLSRVD